MRLVSESAGEHGQEDLADAALLSRVAVADSDALAALYQRHGTACYRLARHITASHDLAQDAVQEAFIGMWKSPAYSTAARQRPDLAARADSPQGGRLGAPGDRPAAAAERACGSAGARPAAAGRRSGGCRLGRHAGGRGPGRPYRAAGGAETALALAYFGGYTQSQIADMTGVPLGTVKTRTFSAMRRLRVGLHRSEAYGGRATVTDPRRDHTRYDELAAGYALHALDPADELEFTGHVEELPALPAGAGRLRGGGDRVADTTPAAEPDQRLGDRILAAAAADRSLVAAAGLGRQLRRQRWPGR